MKHLLSILFVSLAFGWSAFAQTPISCLDAKSKATGTTVTVSGIVMNGDELGPIRYIDDGTAGVALYFGTTGIVTGKPVVRGDSIVATGKVAPYNSLFELTPISAYTVVSHSNTMHGPVVYNPGNFAAAFAEENEGRLVRLNKVASILTTSNGQFSTFTGNTNYNVNGDATLQLRVNNASTGLAGLVDKPAPTDTVSVVGIMSQFSTTPTKGYQLLPRLYNDIIGGALPKPNIISLPALISADTNLLQINYSTQFNGSTTVYYGTSPLALTDSIVDTTQQTGHFFAMPNLKPGTVYFIQAKSTNPYGTSTALTLPFVTISKSTGTIKSFFTQTIRTEEALPGNVANYLPRLVDDTLIAYIDKAKETLDIAIYNWNNSGLSDITAAVNNAYARGVKVRVIADGSTAQIGLTNLNSKINVLNSPQGAAPGGGFYTIMHNKFVIIDADSKDPNSPWVWTGSTNWTNAMINSDWNNVVVVQDQSLARTYKIEFEEMWGSDSLKPGAVFNGTTGTARFGPTKIDNTPHTIFLPGYNALAAGRQIDCYFSPTDGVQSKINNNLSNAINSFQIAVFNCTRSDAATAIRNKASVWNNATINCARFLTEDTTGSGTGSAFKTIAYGLKQNAAIFTPAGIFHHKYAIIDQDAGSVDPKVITGSHNWSNAADQRNDENTIVIHDRNLANQFYQEFSARWEQDGKASCLAVAIAPALSSKISLAPIPAEDVLMVSIPKLQGRIITVLNTQGSVVLTQKAASNSYELSVKTLPPGAYLLQVEGMAVPARFVKQ